MLRFFSLLLLLSCLGPVPAAAQVLTIQPRAGITSNDPQGGFTVGVRLIGRAQVSFGGIGTISSPGNPGDLTSEMSRFYDDGIVGTDTRTNSDGLNLPDDGRTNRWSMEHEEQVLADMGAIAFHTYSSVGDGAFAEAESKPTPGIDVEFSQRWGRWGGKLSNDSTRWIWGGMAGFSVDFINAKTRGTIATSLRTVTDLYSLDGAAPPSAPYSAPSSETVTVTDPSGNPISSTIDTTTFLLNRPFSRTETTDAGGAEVEGFWQVHGAYLSARAGLWARWNLSPRLSLRASAGASYSLFGLDARYDEWISSIETPELVRTNAMSETEKPGVAGVFASLDTELWLTRNTGFYASLTYDRVSKRIQIPIEDRTADVDLDSGLGFRVGVTYRF